MQNPEDQLSTTQAALRYVASYSALFVFGGVGMWLVLQARELLISIGFLFRANPWQIRAIDIWGTFLLGLCWLIGFLVVDSYLRHGVRSHLLGRRIIRVFSITAVIAAGIYVGNWII